MQRLESINPDRISWCCAERRVGIDELSAEVRIPYATLDRVMSAESGLTFTQLQKIAGYFGRGVLFFLESGPVNEDLVHSTNFRTLSNQKPSLSAKMKAIIERAEKQKDVYLQLLKELNLESTQSYRPPNVTGQDPTEAAAIVREWVGVDDENNFESYRNAIEARGLLVFRSNGYNGKWQIPRESPILGFSLYDTACPLIFVRKQNSESRQTFTLAHELGHLLLHRTSSIDDEADVSSNDGVERDANRFAGNFLVPGRFLEQIGIDERPREIAEFDDWLRDYRRAWGVSTDVILLRLIGAGRLDAAAYRNYRAWRDLQLEVSSDGGTRTFRHREPKHLFGDKFVMVVLDSLNSRKITLNRASRYLDSLKLKDLHKLSNFYVGH